MELFHRAMPFAKGQSGNPGGRSTEKAFLAALRVAINQTGKSGRTKLDMVARRLVACAIAGEGWAIQQVADRLDGRPMQESTLNIIKHDATDWTIAELDAIIAADEAASSGRAEAPIAGAREPDQLH
jgi:hypothetical protein